MAAPLLLGVLLAVTLLVILGASLVTWYCLFYASLRVMGLAYAIGHMVICMAFMLIGIMVVPLLVLSDIERWRPAEVALPDGSEPTT